MRHPVGKWQFLVWMAMGVSVLAYAVWSGKAGSGAYSFFLAFPALCGMGHGLAKHPWLRWVIWPFMILMFSVTMLDLGMSRSNDPWFSSTLHRTIIGLIGLGALVSGCVMRRGVGKPEMVNRLPAPPRFWPS